MTRPLSLKQAQSCENARTPRCECRCGGRLHGAGRFGEHATRDEIQATLQPEDPHYPTGEPDLFDEVGR